MSAKPPTGPRTVALVGPYVSGKTTLLESILALTGKVHRQGKISEGNTVGDASQEARDRGMSVEINVATTEFLDSPFTFLDCPGSVEFAQETFDAIRGADMAVVVCEPEPDKAPALVPLFKMLDDLELPRFVFVNKMDRATGAVDELLGALQDNATKPLVLRQMPILDGETVTGYVDLASERAFNYRPGEASEQIDIPADLSEGKDEARFQMMEKLADFNETLMEQLLEDQEPPKDDLFSELTKDVTAGLIAPVLLGSAEHAGGVHRLMKALRHEGPTSEPAAER